MKRKQVGYGNGPHRLRYKHTLLAVADAGTFISGYEDICVDFNFNACAQKIKLCILIR